MDLHVGRTAALLRPALVCLALAALASCSGNSTYAPPLAPYTYTPSPAASPGAAVTASDLDGTSYTSTSVHGHTLLPRTAVKLAFQGGTMAASGACNTMTGPYDVSGGVLRWTHHPSSTLKLCGAALMAQDNWVTSTFTQGVQAAGDASGGLRLSNDTVVIYMSPNSG